MNNNRLHFTIILLILIGSSKMMNAQTSLGIKAGMNFSNVSMKNESGSYNSTQSIPGMQIGLTLEIPLLANFYLQPAVLYLAKGFKQEDSWFANQGNEFKVKVSYLELPVNLLYKPELGIGNLFIGAGPYVGYGTGGKWEAESDVLIGDIRIENHGDVIFNDDVMKGEFGNYLYGKPLDYGASFLVGYELKNSLSLQFNFQRGLADLQPDINGVKGNGKLKNRSFEIAIGYRFK